MIRTPNISFPAKAKLNDVIEIKVLITHEMSPGQKAESREQDDIPPLYIQNFAAFFNNKRVFSAELTPEISANPFLSFFMKVTEPGTMVFTWQENNGKLIASTEHTLTVVK